MLCVFFFFFYPPLLSNTFLDLLQLFSLIIDKKELDIEMAHLVAASVEVKGEEEGNGNENDGRRVRRQSEVVKCKQRFALVLVLHVNLAVF